MQRHAADDRVSRPDRGRGLPDGAAGWYRTIVVLAALPIALTANVARIVLTGYIMHFVNRDYASGTYHTLEGILMMGFGLLLLNSVCSLLNQFCQDPSEPEAGDSFGPRGRDLGIIVAATSRTSHA